WSLAVLPLSSEYDCRCKRMMSNWRIFPGYRGKVAPEAGTLAEMLKPHAYRSYMVGKWHVTPLTEAGSTGPFDGRPLARGFDRFYGSRDAEVPPSPRARQFEH